MQMRNSKKMGCLWIKYLSRAFILIGLISSSDTSRPDNNTQSEDEAGKYLKSVSNISNSSPELIEYYDADDVSIGPDTIYPDPDSLVETDENGFKSIARHHNNIGRSAATTRFNALQELKTPIDEIKENKFKGHSEATTLIDNNSGGYDDGFKGKSIDFDAVPQHTLHTDNELNNGDLRDHDIIDNIMYIYYGSYLSHTKSLGGSIIIVGTVFALAAQILAIIFTLLRNRQIRRVNHLATISLNLLLTLCASNLVFIVGVQTSRNILKCEMIAILLHYFHLSTAIWGLCHSFSIYDYVINENIPIIKYNNLLAYGASAVFVLFSFAISSTSYEIYDYCWMSVQRGMIVNFMIPTSILIILTTIFGTMTMHELRSVVSKQRQVIVESIENILDKCQHIDATVNGVNLLAPDSNLNSEYIPTVKCCDEMDKVHCETGGLKSVDFYDSKFDLGALSIADLSLQSSSDSQDFAEFKRAIKFSLFFQPAFSVCWFLGVVALENRQSCIMPVTFILCYNILNWYILYRFPTISPLIIPSQVTNETSLNKNSKKNCQLDSSFSLSDEVNQTPSCTDTIPLLCSVTGGNNNSHTSAGGCGNNLIVNNHVTTVTASAGGTPTFQSSNLCLSKQISLEDIIYKTSISQWNTSMENINLDCISAISN